MNDKYQKEKQTHADKQVCAFESSNKQQFLCLSNEKVHMNNKNTRIYSKSQ